MKLEDRLPGLDVDIENLAAAIHTVGWIYAVRAVQSIIC